MTDGEKERIKLLATMLNTLGTNVIIVGFVVPIVALIYGLQSAPPVEKVMPALVIWPVAGFVLHLLGRLNLRSLDP